jgi:hypothetical protein
MQIRLNSSGFLGILTLSFPAKQSRRCCKATENSSAQSEQLDHFSAIRAPRTALRVVALYSNRMSRDGTMNRAATTSDRGSTSSASPRKDLPPGTTMGPAHPV